MFLIRGLVFTHEAVRDWEAKLAPRLAEGLRKRRVGKAGRCWPCDRVTPRAAMSPGSLRPTISSASTLRLEPSIPVSTRRKTNFILIPQPLKPTAGHSLPSTTPAFL